VHNSTGISTEETDMQATYSPAKLLAFLPVALLLHACSQDSDYDFETGIANQAASAAAAAPPQARFDPANSVIPFPNSLLFAGSEDGTINIPVADPDAPGSASTVALNQMDGFSTTAPIVAQLSREVDPATLVLGSTVRVFEVATVESGGVAQVLNELGAAEVFVTQSGSNLVILPLQPLREKTDYMVVLTDGIQDAAGVPLAASLPYRLVKGSTVLENAAAALEPVRALTGSMLAAAGAFAAEITADNVVLSWTFKTQSIRDVLQAVKLQIVPTTITVAPTGMTTQNIVPALQGKADVYIGTIELPYYLTAPADDNSDNAAALSSFWQDADSNAVSRFSPMPVATSMVTVPVTMTVPNGASAGQGQMPQNGWPITIYQHGITRNRTDVIVIADAMADAGIALIAMDLPMHGLTDPENGFAANNTAFPNDRERTFGIDVLANPTGDDDSLVTVPGPDGVPDESGAHFYNIGLLSNARDNLRQGVADLLVLSASIGNLQTVPDVPSVQVDASNKTFIAHSLGGLVGTTFLAYDDSITTASLITTGGGVARLLSNSGAFGPILNANLAANGAPPGSAAYEQFLTVAQTVIDSGDPINHAAALADRNTTALHMIKVVDDGTVPNNVPSAPLSGTDPLVRQLRVPQIAGSTAGSGLVVLTEGTHSSLLDPSASVAATVETQSEIAFFAASRGAMITISNTDIVQPLP
jgi:hypothetical protein